MSIYNYQKKNPLKNQRTNFREKLSGLGVSSDDKGNGIDQMNKLGRYIYFISNLSI